MIAPNTNLLSYTASHLRSHLLTTLPVPTKSFAGQTILITGANSGIGLEAARYFVRLGASKVILGVRSPEKGAAAAKEIISSISPSEIQGRNPEDVIQVWELDLCRYASVLSFSERVNRDLDKLDVAVMNAGVLQYDFVREEENDVNITVNVVSTLVLGISLLPKLRQTSQSTGQTGILSFVGSFTHWMTAFPERTSASEPGGIFGRLADEKKSGKRPGEDRYYVSKLIQLLMIRELAERMTLSERGKEGGKVVVNVVNPGFVQTQIMRHATFPFKLFLTGLRKAMARSAEEGARTLVHAASVGEEGHGGYLDDCAASEPSVWVQSEEGHEVQKQLWQELSAKLEMIQPGIMETI
ncbi:putative short-chain dehydrogenase [Podospora australis]|uniref:Short-chain dehydrogenase n=1 Tax=Podospora australis TaxID=1536484 RepID=A0AAN6WX00_9PEZI|nr:putative short-chain dehydrogenase [Podospora australis]